MKICHQLNNLAIGGVETYVYRLARHASEETMILSHRNDTVGDWIIEELPHVKLFITSNGEEISSILNEEKPDVFVMHTGSYLPEYFPSLKERFPDMKFVVVLHTVYPVEYIDDIDALVCVSDTVRIVQPDSPKVHVIKPGVEKRDLVIGNVTRIAPYKYIEDMYSLSDILGKEGIHHTVAIVGEDAQDAVGYRDHLENGRYGNVLFLGKLDPTSLKAFYTNISIFFHPVGNEAYPAVILEAQEYNVPVITYPRGGATEIPNVMFVNNAAQAAQAVISFRRSVKDIK